MAKLIVVDGPELGNEFEVERPPAGTQRSSIIGRDPRADITLKDNAVSREHCRLEASASGYRVIDLGSRNQTFLNGDPVQESRIREGDVLLVGDTELRFEGDECDVRVTGVASTIIKEIEIADRLEGTSGAPANAEPRGGSSENESAVLAEIVTLAREIEQRTSEEGVFDRFLNALASAFRADHVVLLARQDGRWAARARAGPGGGAGNSLVASLSVIEHAARERKVILSATTASSPRSKGSPCPRSMLAAPLMGSRDTSGVVYVERSEEPFETSDLDFLRRAVEPLACVVEAIENRERLVTENRNLLRAISEERRIKGTSEPMLEVLDFVRRAAPTPSTILIEGETGTGKELVASAIHYGSPRRGKPFIPINCAALPEHLAESELFGHERGAFTGAVSRKKGRFEMADTGTVFLDEVGELAIPVQAKLLRLLEERKVEHVGGTEPIEVDVRVVAATNKDLLQAVAAGEFREDLYYRLSVLAVRLPPLRERTDDVPVLAEHFLGLLSHGLPAKKLSKKALHKLLGYSWPGNARQLKNVIESAVVLGDGPEIEPEDLILPDQARSSDGETWQPISLQELERRHVLRVLEHTNGNKTRAAEILGIERCTLYSKLKNYSK